MELPIARGPMSEAIVAGLRRNPGAELDRRSMAVLARRTGDPLADGDLQLALAICYELHFQGFAEVHDGWEWDPGLIAVRGELEAVVEQSLRRRCAVTNAPTDVCAALRELIAADDAPKLSAYMTRRATIAEFREFIAQRSVYHLREADPHTFGIPRLSGRAKSALVEIQSDEYGAGIPGRMHSELYANLMRGVGLPADYGHFWDSALPETLATVNAMSLFGLHRRLRAALVGHLAALEMTSTAPNRRYGNGLRRLGYGPEVTRFYDEHVEADAVHEQLACVDLCGALVDENPAAAGDVLFGARCSLWLDGRVGAALLARWNAAAVTRPAIAGGRGESDRPMRPVAERLAR